MGGWGGIKEGKQVVVVVVEEYLDFRSRFRPPKRMDDGTLKVENVVVLFLYSFSFYLCVTSNRTSSSNENHFEMCINPHDMEAEFQSDDERNNSDGGNMEFVR